MQALSHNHPISVGYKTYPLFEKPCYSMLECDGDCGSLDSGIAWCFLHHYQNYGSISNRPQDDISDLMFLHAAGGVLGTCHMQDATLTISNSFHAVIAHSGIYEGFPYSPYATHHPPRFPCINPILK